MDPLVRVFFLHCLFERKLYLWWNMLKVFRVNEVVALAALSGLNLTNGPLFSGSCVFVFRQLLPLFLQLLVCRGLHSQFERLRKIVTRV